jgi:hypothetical protein
MPDTANTAIKVCSRASILMGGSPILSFVDGTVEADVCDAMYEDVSRAALTSSRWGFATNQSVLNRLSAAPVGRFDAAYQLAAGTLTVAAVTISDNPIIFDTYGNKVYCDASATEEVVADYIYRASEVDWAPYFTIAVEYSMAAVLATSVARDVALSQLMEQKAASQMMLARRLDSQRQTTQKLNTSRFITQRRS